MAQDQSDSTKSVADGMGPICFRKGAEFTEQDIKAMQMVIRLNPLYARIKRPSRKVPKRSAYTPRSFDDVIKRIFNG